MSTTTDTETKIAQIIVAQLTTETDIIQYVMDVFGFKSKEAFCHLGARIAILVQTQKNVHTIVKTLTDEFALANVISGDKIATFAQYQYRIIIS